MAREPEARVTPDTFARGKEPEAPEHREPILSGPAAALVIVIALIIDIVGFFEVEIPISDTLALTMNFILLYKGVSQTRWIVGQLLELIPLVGILPIYTIGILLVIAADRSGIADVVEKVPVPSGKKAVAKGAAKGVARQQGKRLASNKVFGEAAKESTERAARLQKRLSGPLRSLPGGEEKTEEGVPLPAGRSAVLKRARAAAGSALSSATSTQEPAPTPPAGDRTDARNPFMDAYRSFESEVLPGLDELTADIDVTGEKAVEEAAKKAAGGLTAPKKVQ